MPLVLQPLVEADLEYAMEIQDRAFWTELWNKIMFPNGMTAMVRTRLAEWARKDFQDPRIVFMKVVDTDRNNEMISFARWYIYKEHRPESDWNKPGETRDLGAGVNHEALNEFKAAMDGKRKKLMAGDPHCYTHPDHQRRGAGSMLVQWGTNIADEAGLRCYLEASQAGHHLYLQKGFEDVDIIELNMAKYGGEGVSRHMCMIRPAKVEKFISL